VKTARFNLTLDAPARATPQSAPSAAMGAAPSAPAVPSAAVFCVGCGCAGAGPWRTMARLRPRKRRCRRGGHRASRKPEKSAAAKRAADRNAAKRARIGAAPFSYRDQLAAH